MSCSRYILGLILVASVTAFGQEVGPVTRFLVSTDGQRKMTRLSTVTFDASLKIELVNTDFVTGDWINVEFLGAGVIGARPDISLGVYTTSTGAVSLQPGESKVAGPYTLSGTVRPLSDFPIGPLSVSFLWDVKMTSQLTGVSSTHRVRIDFLGEVDYNTSDVGPEETTEDLGWTFRNDAPATQVWYKFGLANMTESQKHVAVHGSFDGNPFTIGPWLVSPGTPESPTERIHEGAFLATTDQFSLGFPGGVLMTGQSVWLIPDDSGTWEAGVVFPSGDIEEMKVRLNVDVFADQEMELVVLDGFGNEVDRLNVLGGVYNTSIDLAFQGFEGHELTFAIVGADGYSITTLSGGGPLASGVNNVHVQLHRADDLPTTVGGTSTTTVDPDGNPVTTTTRVYVTDLGTLTVTGSNTGPWNPDQRFGGTYSFGSVGDGERVLMGIDAGVAAVAANGGAVPSMEGESPYSGQVGDIADGLRGGIGTLPKPETVSAAQEDEWVINLPPINGVEVPTIVVPLSHPAIGWIRLVMCILVYALWLEKTIRLIKT